MYLSSFISEFPSRDPVVKKGEELLRKKAAGANLDDPGMINRLFLLFNGMIHIELFSFFEMSFFYLSFILYFKNGIFVLNIYFSSSTINTLFKRLP